MTPVQQGAQGILEDEAVVTPVRFEHREHQLHDTDLQISTRIRQAGVIEDHVQPRQLIAHRRRFDAAMGFVAAVDDGPHEGGALGHQALEKISPLGELKGHGGAVVLGAYLALPRITDTRHLMGAEHEQRGKYLVAKDVVPQ